MADDKEQTGLLKEFDVLRTELLKRVEFQYQMIALSLTFSGVYLGLVIQKSDGQMQLPLLLILPWMMALLAVAWVQNNAGVCNLGRYIMNRIEPRIPGMNWEGYRFQARKHPGDIRSTFKLMDGLGSIVAAGIFFGMQAVALGLAAYFWYSNGYSMWWSIPFVLDMVCAAATLYLLRWVLPRYWRLKTEPWDEISAPTDPVGVGQEQQPSVN